MLFRSPVELKMIKIKTFKDLDELRGKTKIGSIITGHLLENNKKLNTDLVKLSPIMFWTRKEISSKLRQIRK